MGKKASLHSAIHTNITCYTDSKYATHVGTNATVTLTGRTTD